MQLAMWRTAYEHSSVTVFCTGSYGQTESSSTYQTSWPRRWSPRSQLRKSQVCPPKGQRPIIPRTIMRSGRNSVILTPFDACQRAKPVFVTLAKSLHVPHGLRSFVKEKIDDAH